MLCFSDSVIEKVISLKLLLLYRNRCHCLTIKFGLYILCMTIVGLKTISNPAENGSDYWIAVCLPILLVLHLIILTGVRLRILEGVGRPCSPPGHGICHVWVEVILVMISFCLAFLPNLPSQQSLPVLLSDIPLWVFGQNDRACKTFRHIDTATRYYLASVQQIRVRHIFCCMKNLPVDFQSLVSAAIYILNILCISGV